jgi:hypothetical protein
VDVTDIHQAARCSTLRLLAAFELDRRLKGSGVDVVACHPGLAATEVPSLPPVPGKHIPRVMPYLKDWK